MGKQVWASAQWSYAALQARATQEQGHAINVDMFYKEVGPGGSFGIDIIKQRMRDMFESDLINGSTPVSHGAGMIDLGTA